MFRHEDTARHPALWRHPPPTISLEVGSLEADQMRARLARTHQGLPRTNLFKSQVIYEDSPAGEELFARVRAQGDQ